MNGSPASLLAAALDLQLVRSLRAAMQAGARVEAGIRVQPRRVIEPAPRIEPRRVIHPTPRVEPRPVVHLRPVELPPLPAACAPIEPETPGRCAELPIQPPWKVLPWQNPPPPPPRLKLIVKPPDVPRKGTVLDVFV